MPYDQCLPHEVARKEDGIAGIDPRNLQQQGKADIEAIGLDEVVITDGNGTIISHHKKTDADDKSKTRKRRESGQDAEPVSVTEKRSEPSCGHLTVIGLLNCYRVRLILSHPTTDMTR